MVTASQARTRIFAGSTEISLLGGIQTTTENTIVDVAEIEVEGNAAIGDDTVIDFRKGDGSTTVFLGRVNSRMRTTTWKLTLLGDGYELNGLKIQQVYLSTTPEAIAKDVIEQTTNLTFGGTYSSGITIEKYMANAYAIDIINDMLFMTNAQLRIDSGNVAFFEQKGNINNARVLTMGDGGVQFFDWDKDKTQVFNNVIVQGAIINRVVAQESADGDGAKTTFTIAQVPAGDVEVKIGGTLQTAGVDGSEDYEVLSEEKKIEFVVAPVSGTNNVTFDYTSQIKVTVDDQDDDAISAQGMKITKEVPAPWIRTFSEARQYAKQLLSEFSTPTDKVKALIPYIDWQIEAGEIVQCVDAIHGKDVNLVAKRIVRKLKESQTEVEFGVKDYDWGDYQEETKDRIKKLERRLSDDEVPAFARIFKHNVKVNILLHLIDEFNNAADSFILGHQTLGRLRTNLDFEADCSDTTNHGTWQGSSIGGSQFNANAQTNKIILTTASLKDAGNTTANWNTTTGRIAIL